MRSIKYLALFALVAFAACDEETTTPVVATGTVQVTVTAAGTGVAGATVSLGAAGTQPAQTNATGQVTFRDRKSTRLNSSHLKLSRMPSSA